MKQGNLAIVFNAMIVLLELLGIFICIFCQGVFDLKYFTIDCNLIALFSSLGFLIFSLLKMEIPKIVKWLKYVATVSLTITFLVVLFVLIPMSHGDVNFYLLSGAMPLHHVLCPLLAFISFVFCEKYDINGWKDIMNGLCFSILYTIVMIVFNVAGIIDGPYEFLRINNQSLIASILWFLSMSFVTVFIAWMIAKLNKCIGER